MKQYKKMKDSMFGGAMALQSTRLLSDRSVGGLTGTASGFVGLGVTGAIGNMAFDMVSKPIKKKRGVM